MQGAVTLGGETIGDANTQGQTGRDLRRRHSAARSPPTPQGQDIPLTVVYEDKDLIVIEKPAGLVVHPAAGNPDGTLVNALIAHCGGSLTGIGGVARPGIVHRLDKDTSGLLVAAKNERAMTEPRQAIRRAYHRARLSRRRLGQPARRRRPYRRPDRAQPLRPQAHGGAARTGQRGAHALSRDRALRRSRTAFRQPHRMPAGNRAARIRSACI